LRFGQAAHDLQQLRLGLFSRIARDQTFLALGQFAGDLLQNGLLAIHGGEGCSQHGDTLFIPAHSLRRRHYFDAAGG
jgi:hypothetical protein